MNKTQRKVVEHIKESLTTAHEELNALSEEEQEKYDNLSEGLQQTVRGQGFEEAATSLSEHADSLSDIIEALEELLNG